MRWMGVGLAALAACGPAPQRLFVSAIEPASVVTGLESHVVIRGRFHPKAVVDFRSGSSTFDREFRASLGSTALDRVLWINDEVLTATVPAVLPEGSHDLVVIDPHGNREQIAAAFVSTRDPCGAYPSLRVLLIARDQDDRDGDVDLSADDRAVVNLFEGAGHTVELFGPTSGGCNAGNDNQAVFDAALTAAWDAIYVADSCETETLVDGTTDDPTAPFYLNSADVGVVFNDDALIDNAFFADTSGSDSDHAINLVDNDAFVTSFLSPGPVTLLDGADAPIGWIDESGTVAAGVVALAEPPSGGSRSSLLLVEAGGELLYGNTAPARRASIPAFAADRWTRSARLLALRALLWVAGEDSCQP